ncbi:MAG: hypothetical protein B7Y12_14510 [Rhizobiales bacterium 24-66-13]|nr:MAG: hypothetical protein B7Y12_14510 [Rhizobiales bacterium 24-66-13]
MPDPVIQQDHARHRPLVRRVLLDTSFVKPDPAPLGIHRVVAQYAVHGARFAAEAGVGFDLVECTADGGFTRRLAPLIGVPQKAAQTASGGSHGHRYRP